METIQLEYLDTIAVVKLNRGITNAINLQLVEELVEILRNVKQSKHITSLILTSSNDKFFCIGFDIPQLYELSREEFYLFYQRFNQMCLDLYALPKPTIAVIPGHATAGGCILDSSWRDFRRGF